MCRSQVRVNSLIIDFITFRCIVSIVLMNYCFISGYILYDIMHTVEALINRHRQDEAASKNISRMWPLEV